MTAETRNLSLAEKVEGLSRRAFIRQYLGEDAEDREITVTARGFHFGGQHGQRALRCACDSELCDGWAVVSDNPHSLDWHMRRHHPMAETYRALAAFLRAKGEQNGDA